MVPTAFTHDSVVWKIVTNVAEDARRARLGSVKQHSAESILIVLMRLLSRGLGTRGKGGFPSRQWGRRNKPCNRRLGHNYTAIVCRYIEMIHHGYAASSVGNFRSQVGVLPLTVGHSH